MTILTLTDTVTLTPDEVEKIIKKAVAEHVGRKPEDVQFRVLQCVFRDGTVCNGWPEIGGIFQ